MKIGHYKPLYKYGKEHTRIDRKNVSGWSRKG